MDELQPGQMGRYSDEPALATMRSCLGPGVLWSGQAMAGATIVCSDVYLFPAFTSHSGCTCGFGRICGFIYGSILWSGDNGFFPLDQEARFLAGSHGIA